MCGYDLLAKAKGSSTELHVEVMCTEGSAAHFFLSETEFKTMESDPAWRLAMVTEATNRSRRKIRYHARRELHREYELRPIQWEGVSLK